MKPTKEWCGAKIWKKLNRNSPIDSVKSDTPVHTQTLELSNIVSGKYLDREIACGSPGAAGLGWI